MSIRPLKYFLDVGRKEVKIPGTPGFSHVAFQGGQLCLWTTVNDNPGHLPTTLDIYVALTGEALPEDKHAEHLGTALDASGEYVLHVYALHEK